MADGQTTAVVCGDLNMLRCFTGTGIPTLVLYADPNAMVRYSRDCRRSAPISDIRANMEQAAADVVRIGRTFAERPVLYYSADETLLMVSRHRQELAPYYRFLLPPGEVVEQLVHKTGFAGLAQRLNLPVPKTLCSREVADAAEAEQRMSLPCIFKPSVRVDWFKSLAGRKGEGASQKALRADTAASFRRVYSDLAACGEDFVIQEYIPGDESCIYSFHAYFDAKSRARAWYVGRKIRTFPKNAGVSTYLELVHEPELAEMGLEILRKLDFVGPVKIDFKKDMARQRYFLLEINSRFTLWNYLGAACGINLPVVAYRDLLGRPEAGVNGYATAVRWLSFGDDARSFIRDYRPAGELSCVSWLLSLRGRKVHDVFSWRDPLPWMVGTVRYLSALFSKWGARLAR